MKKWLLRIWFSFLCISTPLLSFAGNFNTVLTETVNTNNELNFFDRIEKYTLSPGAEGIRDFIGYVMIKVLIPVVVWGGIFLAIIGFYKLLTTDDEKEQKKWYNYITRGIVGIMIMLSAGYVVNQLVGSTWEQGILGGLGKAPSGAMLAADVYVKILFPFLKMFIFFVLGILFIIAIINAYKYLFNPDKGVQGKSLSILIYTVMGCLVIILAKSIVELVYGPYADVVNSSVVAWGTDLGGIGKGVLNDPKTQFEAQGWVYTVINWILGLTTLIVVIIIIVQGYSLLTNPTDEDQIKKIKTNMGYIFIGILIIGAGYLITNFVIVT